MQLEDLAIHGGPAACPFGPPSWPLDDDDVLAALNFTYADRSWGKYEGPNGEIFRQKLADYHDVEFVTLCCSGTIGVELALRGLKVGPGDEVILAGYDFAGHFAAIEAVRATPVVVDVEPTNFNLDPRQVPAAITDKTKAILVSHLHGGVVPMRELRVLADERNIAIVEDACQMPGGIVEGKTAGTWGDVGVLSFGGSKLLTAGRGGAILTPHEEIFQRTKLYSNRGNSAFPLSELQAAVLRPQFAKLDKRNAQRHGAVEHLRPKLAALPTLEPLVNRVRKTVPGYYKLGMKYKPEALGGLSREEFIEIVRAEGVDVGAGFRGFARRSERRCRKVGSLDHSREAARSVVLLHHPVLLEDVEVLDQVARAFEKVTTVFTQAADRGHGDRSGRDHGSSDSLDGDGADAG
ncbi:MAG TPA: aminotransferase class I/II-fold pyridoxal phosphate-dependent enzyme [Pirellulales bacterium]